MSKRAIRITTIILFIYIVAITFFIAFDSVAFADTLNFDDTYVLEDLQSSKTFNVKDYPANKNKTATVIKTAEYCYTENADYQENFGVYFYVHNPQQLKISDTNRVNKVKMGVEYNSDGAVSKYEFFDLILVSRTTTDYKDLFLKFKLVDKKINNKYMLDRLNPIERRYDIASIMLKETNKQLAVDYSVSKTYYYSGFSKGYAKNTEEESSLKCKLAELETIELKVEPTFYRTESSSKGKGYQHQLSSVYFNVPNEILDKYGKLQIIDCSWLEYKTQPIVVTETKKLYEGVTPFLGIDVSKNKLENKYNFYNSNIIKSFMYNYNFGIGESANTHNILYYLFYKEDLKKDIISVNELTEYIYGYNKSFVNGKIPGRDISADLFANTVDVGKTMGYNSMKINADSKFDLISYSGNWWNKFVDYGFFKVDLGVDRKEIEPIYKITDSDVSVESAINNKLLVYNGSAVKTYYNSAKAKNESTYLFRFANRDYYSESLITHNGFTPSNEKSYYAEQTVFLDFTVISLTFRNEIGDTVLAVVSSPVDIIGSITPPIDIEKNPDFWKKAIAILIIIVLAIILIPILIPIIKLIISIVLLPFQLIVKIFKSIFKKK